MIRSTQELSKPIKLAVNTRAVLFSHILLVVTIIVHTVLDPSLHTLYRVLSLAIGAVLALMIVFGATKLESINKHPILHIALYQTVAAFGIIFITDASTPYVVILFIIMFLYNLYYGKKGVWIGVGIFGLMTIAKYIYLSFVEHVSSTNQLTIVITFFLFLAVSMFYINIQSIYEWDRAQLRDTIQEAVIEQKRLRALINNMTESVLVLDKEGIIRLYNAAALALFNTNSSLSDKPLDGFIRLEDDKGKIITTPDLLPKTSKPIVRTDIKIRYTQDDTSSLSITATPIRSTFGQERDEEGYVITMRDITREKSLEEERDEFISVISHELRTPVTVAEAGVSNALLLAKRMPDNEKITKSLQTAHDQSVFLANMLNDLTTFARAEKGTLEMNVEEFNPREMLANLGDDYLSAVKEKGMNIQTKSDPSTPLIMASNRLYIREILQNFLTNAIKYSDKGTITLYVRAKEKGVLYSVADEGIGISVSDQKKVFEKFFRTEDYRTRSTNGTGLGLYIVKKLAKILGASFEVKSEVGKGSTFSLYVPDKGDMFAVQKAALAQPVPATHISNQPATPNVVSTSSDSTMAPITVQTEAVTPTTSLAPVAPMQTSIEPHSAAT